MSKKKNKKIKNVVKQAPISENQPVENANIEANAAQPTAATETLTLDDKYRFVGRDIKKILLIISILLLVLVGCYFLGLKTSVLSTFGDWVYKMLNIQT